MLFAQRVFLSDNGVISDISTEVNDFRNGTYTIPLVTGEDCIYIGTFLPFNHRYIDLLTPNSVSAGVTVEIWNGTTFVAAVDVIDQTRVGAVSLAQSGVIRWSCDRDQVWVRELDSFSIPGLQSTNVPGFFWVRLSWSASLTITSAIKFIGQKFSKDQELVSFYPDLANTQLMEAFATGKTNWEEQHFIAGEQIVRDLKRQNIILSADQILDFEILLEPSVRKTAELIYAGLGQPYADRKVAAEAAYTKALDMKHLNIDANQDGNLNQFERVTRTGFLTR